MAVTEQSKKYVARGKSFDTKEEAKRYDDLHDARIKLAEAQRVFQRLLAENAVTADGENFEFGVFRNYHFIVFPIDAKPRLQEISYMCWSWEVRETEDHPEVVEIREERDEQDGRRSSFVPIRELYANQKKAEKALHAEQVRWLEQQRREIEGMKQI